MINKVYQKRTFKLIEYLFYIGFLSIVFSYFIGSTTLKYKISFPIEKSTKILGICLLILYILAKKNYTIKSIIVSVTFFLFSVGIWYWGTDDTLLILSLLIFSSSELSMKRILKIHFIMTLLLLVLMMVLSQMGLILEIVLYRDGAIRRSFGIIYATDFAAHVFYSFLEYSILKRNKYKMYDVFIGIILGLFIYKYCDARLDTISVFLTGIAFYVINKVKFKKVKKTFCKASFFAFPICFLISFITSYFYNPNNSILSKLNQLLSSRLTLGKQAFNDYSIKWFGQYIQMNGNGGLTGMNRNRWIDKYFIIDSSFLRILLMNGIIGLLMVFIIYSMLSLVAIKHKDKYFALAIMLVCIHAIVAQFLIHVGYTVLPVLLLSLYDFNKNKLRVKDETLNLQSK